MAAYEGVLAAGGLEDCWANPEIRISAGKISAERYTGTSSGTRSVYSKIVAPAARYSSDLGRSSPSGLPQAGNQREHPDSGKAGFGAAPLLAGAGCYPAIT